MRRQSRLVGHIAPRAIICVIAILAAAPAWAQTNIVRIEEHWELQLSQPERNSSAPQTSMVMSATGDSSGVYFLFTLNHQSEPNYSPGGMQVQLWDGETLLDERSAHEGGTFTQDGEVVHWVQRMSVNEGSLKFTVVDGSSDTWGLFGGDYLKLSVPSPLTNLNGYRPGVSLTESQVNFAENRVVSLTLTKLVWETDDGQEHEMNAPIPVDTSLDP